MMKSLFCPLILLTGSSLVSGFVLAQVKTQAQLQNPSTAIDFSYAGYGGGAITIPDVPVVVTVRPAGGDDQKVIQGAINYLAGLPVQNNGFRGALRLHEGTFHVSGSLRLAAEGIVLSGSGDKTVIIATGKTRRSLIEVGNAKAPAGGEPIRITDTLVPAGSFTLTLESVQGLQAGDRVIVTRPSTREWIESEHIKMQAHWPAGSRDITWDRTIKAVEAARSQVVLDAPITTALEWRYGGGTVAKIKTNEPVRFIGLENFVLQSEYETTNPKDEEHAWFGISLDNVEDAWVRGITARHFVSSAVRAGPRARRVTVMNCRSEQPVSEIGGYRRQSFFVEGQQVLVQKCLADSGINDFAIGLLAAGPNVFLRCTATNALGPSGSFESWASGVLYENVQIDSAGLRLAYDLKTTQAGGWTAANSVLWNCTAKDIAVEGPGNAPVIAMISPESEYRKQLAYRTFYQATAADRDKRIREDSPDSTIYEFKPSDVPPDAPVAVHKQRPLQIVNGRFVVEGKTAWGGAVNDGWWLGFAAPGNALDGGISITRFMPGRVGPGLTEDLPGLADQVVRQKTPFYQSGPYGLWYDRRRDEHSIIERPDGNVWAPFLEIPWARSGRGKAWDGLSKYDLTKYNPWYFNRLREFAALCDQHGIVLYHHAYNNHNLVEVGPHWVDFSWRPVNNINNTGFPEPPPYDEKKRIHLANEFYDVGNPNLRQLHRSYILHLLDHIGFNQNIILGTGFQFFGPLEFQKFFQQTVAEWEKKNNHNVRIVLCTSKDITDAILADADLSRQVAVIDTRYWQYLPDGTLWAPPGGKNLAFREHVTEKFGKSLDFPDATTPFQAYRQVREYSDKYPDKAVVAWHNEVGPVPALMAGAAQVLMRNPAAGHRQGRTADVHLIDSFVREHLAASLMKMKPRDGMLANGENNWMLADDRRKTILIYSHSGPEIKWKKNLQGSHSGIWFDPQTGKSYEAEIPKKPKKGRVILKPTKQNWLLLLKE